MLTTKSVGRVKLQEKTSHLPPPSGSGSHSRCSARTEIPSLNQASSLVHVERQALDSRQLLKCHIKSKSCEGDLPRAAERGRVESPRQGPASPEALKEKRKKEEKKKSRKALALPMTPLVTLAMSLDKWVAPPTGMGE